MLNVLAWSIALYAALKLCHLVLGRSKGLDGEPIPYKTRLRAGEPALAIGTAGLVAVLMLYTIWWSHKFNMGHYARASACYPKLAAAGSLPALPARFRSYEAAESVIQLRQVAEEHGAALGIDPAEVDRRLEGFRLVYAKRYSALVRNRDRQGIAAAFVQLDRCLRGEGAPRGDILNPI